MGRESGASVVFSEMEAAATTASPGGALSVPLDVDECRRALEELCAAGGPQTQPTSKADPAAEAVGLFDLPLDACAAAALEGASLEWAEEDRVFAEATSPSVQAALLSRASPPHGEEDPRRAAGVGGVLLAGKETATLGRVSRGRLGTRLSASRAVDSMKERNRQELRDRRTLDLAAQIVARFKGASRPGVLQLVHRFFDASSRHVRDPQELERLVGACCYVIARQQGEDLTLHDITDQLEPRLGSRGKQRCRCVSRWVSKVCGRVQLRSLPRQRDLHSQAARTLKRICVHLKSLVSNQENQERLLLEQLKRAYRLCQEEAAQFELEEEARNSSLASLGDEELLRLLLLQQQEEEARLGQTAGLAPDASVAAPNPDEAQNAGGASSRGVGGKRLVSSDFGRSTAGAGSLEDSVPAVVDESGSDSDVEAFLREFDAQQQQQPEGVLKQPHHHHHQQPHHSAAGEVAAAATSGLWSHAPGGGGADAFEGLVTLDAEGNIVFADAALCGGGSLLGGRGSLGEEAGRASAAAHSQQSPDLIVEEEGHVVDCCASSSEAAAALDAQIRQHECVLRLLRHLPSAQRIKLDHLIWLQKQRRSALQLLREHSGLVVKCVVLLQQLTAAAAAAASGKSGAVAVSSSTTSPATASGAVDSLAMSALEETAIIPEGEDPLDERWVRRATSAVAVVLGGDANSEDLAAPVEELDGLNKRRLRDSVLSCFFFVCWELQRACGRCDAISYAALFVLVFEALRVSLAFKNSRI